MRCDDNTFILGETIEAAVAITFDGEPADADTVTAVAIDQDGESHAATVVAGESTGEHFAYYTTATDEPAGPWEIRITVVKGARTRIGRAVFEGES